MAVAAHLMHVVDGESNMLKTDNWHCCMTAGSAHLIYVVIPSPWSPVSDEALVGRGEGNSSAFWEKAYDIIATNLYRRLIKSCGNESIYLCAGAGHHDRSGCRNPGRFAYDELLQRYLNRTVTAVRI